MVKHARWAAIIAFVALIDVGLWMWLRSVPRKVLGGHVVVTVQPAAALQATLPASADVQAPPAPTPPASGPTLLVSSSAPPGPVTIATALEELFGSKTVLSMFQVADFAQRFVATVDKLGRPKAPSRLWPLTPVPGPFMVDWQGATGVIGIDNGLRYTPYVLLMESVDLQRAVQLYAELSPQFQRAYEDSGFAGQLFHDRLLVVIDQLLASPSLGAAPKVRLPVPVDEAVAARPWVLYQFDDPGLEAANAGQKLMIRMGAVNQRRVKVKLAELRRLLLDLGGRK